MTFKLEDRYIRTRKVLNEEVIYNNDFIQFGYRVLTPVRTWDQRVNEITASPYEPTPATGLYIERLA